MRADWKDDVRYTKLAAALGSALPTGSGVPISQVEAGGAEPVKYFPYTGDTEFADVTFIDGTNLQANGISTHATYVGQTIYGNTSSVAPGADSVTIYEAGHWLSQQLKVNGGTPQTQSFRVQNHSWVGSFDSTPATPPTQQELNSDIDALRRFDYIISRDNITACVGLNNGLSAMPRLFAQSYNSIGVGLSSGQHSTGLTDIANYGPGRSKPDLVLPFSSVSGATGGASSAATFLHSVPQVVGTNAAKSETMKAILMAGASKSEFPTWTRTATQPLDETYGAGELDLYNSYLITQGGQQAGAVGPGSSVGSYGWDYQSISPGTPNQLNYRFHIPAGSFAQELSILLAWNVDVSYPSFGSQTLVNLDLRLTDSLGQTIDQSISTVDNVEHLRLTDLTAGDYTLTVTNNSATAHAFGLAWRTATLFGMDSNNLAPSADFDEDGFITGSDFLAWQRGNGKLLNASHAEGDADGDGDVDADDRMVFLTQYNPVLGAAAVALAAVPEPSSFLLATGAVAAYFLVRKRRAG